ncbi:MAG: hypothetical protein AAF617_12240 [Bacteroidota bacterium]
MKVLKSTPEQPRICKFGNFTLVPDDGWEISQSFIDFESGLLIVSTSDRNEENWIDTGYGSRTIPSKQYRIDPKSGDILTRDEWSKYFSYLTTEQISIDKKYKLITTRVYEPERDSDGIEEELIDLTTGKKISSSTGIAFQEDKRENLLESLYRQQKERQAYEAKIAALPTLAEFYEKQLKSLKKGAILLRYTDSKNTYMLTYNGTKFELYALRKKNTFSLNWRASGYKKIASFTHIEDFVTAHMKDKAWFMQNRPFYEPQDDSHSNQLLKKFVIDFFNSLRKNHDFTFEEYTHIQFWENHFYEHDSVKRSAYKQYCGHCKQPVRYNPRYPKYICGDCSSKVITDENGYELSFYNIGMSGGLRVIFKKDEKVIKEDTSLSEQRCFIDGKPFIATEGRFGGIVIQSEV